MRSTTGRARKARIDRPGRLSHRNWHRDGAPEGDEVDVRARPVNRPQFRSALEPNSVPAGGLAQPLGHYNQPPAGPAQGADDLTREPVSVLDLGGTRVPAVQAARDEHEFVAHFRRFHVVKEIA
jgi:hypothetical protein